SLSAVGKLERGTKMRAPLRASAPSRSSTSLALATMVSECSLASRTRSKAVPVKVFAPFSGGSRYQRLEEKSASGEALWGRTLNQPFTPQASRTRPTSTASAGNSAGSRPASISLMPVRANPAGLRCLFGGLADQTLHGGGSLSAHAGPVGQPILRHANAFLVVLGDRVVKPDALDETAVTARALVGHDDIEERTRLGAAA